MEFIDAEQVSPPPPCHPAPSFFPTQFDIMRLDTIYHDDNEEDVPTLLSYSSERNRSRNNDFKLTRNRSNQNNYVTSRNVSPPQKYAENIELL
ncbi:sortilin, putative [Plasmodium ovale wallikeri]|uniref:Sortilin, putative n=1 Tax=Plasmodium ovale wallikeri TaxID=864142 RepID=A0A1A8ZFW6_PLAOA|nr:sortilin, putative [Plasmodium ovale wallikeri]